MIAGLANHLWQSTLFALAAAALAAALRGNRASVRHGIWVIASVKWLVPFAWLLALGSHLTFMNPSDGIRAADALVPAAVATAARQAAEPFAPAGALAALPSLASSEWLTVGLAAIWVAGFLAVALMRLRDWRRIRAAVRRSTPVDVVFPGRAVPVRSAPGLLEPGVVGLWRPVLLLPMGIEHQLTPAQLQSVLVHESSHVRRRDNLSAAVHMVTETPLWFHPLVWWIGARLVDERERACDEDVLALGVRPRDYADGILHVCRLYVESPLACVAGVSGSNLSQLTGRIEDIMMSRIGQKLSITRRIIVAAAAAIVVAAPIVLGGMTTVQAQSTPPVSTVGVSQSAPVGDLASVVKVIGNSSAAPADRDRLIGKTYSGMVVIQTVRLPENDRTVAIVVALPSGLGDNAGTIGLRFTGRADDARLQALRKDKTVRVRGTLTGFSTERSVVWADFADLVIEDSGPAR